MFFRFYYFIPLFFFFSPLLSQQIVGKGKLTGILVTSGTNEPMPFATISIYTPKDSLVEGSLSEENSAHQFHFIVLGCERRRSGMGGKQLHVYLGRWR